MRVGKWMILPESVTQRLQELQEDITNNFSLIRENDEDFLTTDVSVILEVLNERISKADRNRIMKRLLERRKREMIRKLIICVYTESENCLEPREVNALHAEIVHVGEFRDFTIRRFVDKYATRLECENIRSCTNLFVDKQALFAFTISECGSSCTPITFKDEDERLDEDEVDKEIDKFKEDFEEEFIQFFEQRPYGAACPSD